MRFRKKQTAFLTSEIVRFLWYNRINLARQAERERQKTGRK